MSARLLHELLERATDRAADAPAVVDGERVVSYGELDAWSNAIARVLVDRGVQPGDRVALYLDKSAEAVAAIYGTLKAGAVYVPFDPTSPCTRLGYIAADAGIRVVCTSHKMLAALRDMTAAGAPVAVAVVLDGPTDQPGTVPEVVGSSAIDAAGTERFSVRRIPEDLAYILYTSGSTGNPKGVMLSHRAALGFVDWAVEAVGVTSTDRCSSHAPLHFDLSIFDLFASAAVGAAVVLVPAATSRFPVEVHRFIERQGITIWYSVPSILSMLTLRGGLTDGALPHLRVVLFAGEVFPTKHLRELMQRLPHAEFWNLYGPTETNVCTAYRVPALAAGDDDAHPDRPGRRGRRSVRRDRRRPARDPRRGRRAPHPRGDGHVGLLERSRAHRRVRSRRARTTRPCATSRTAPATSSASRPTATSSSSGGATCRSRAVAIASSSARSKPHCTRTRTWSRPRWSPFPTRWSETESTRSPRCASTPPTKR